jgi:DNA polymerase III subunit delta
MAVTFQNLIKKIRAKKFARIYVLDGEEAYFIDKICDAIEQHALSDAERDFNLSVYYGKDAQWSEVVTACRRFPMFAERQVVILREAQQMKDLEELALYWENPSDTTVFVLAHKHGKLDKRKSVLKKLIDKHTYLTCDAIKEEHLPTWITDLGKVIGLNMGIEVALLLANTLGSDLGKVEKELEKVKLNKTDGDVLTEKDVEKYIGVSIEFAVFKFPDAIIARDTKRVYKMLNYFVANPKEVPTPLVAAIFYNAYSRMYAIQCMAGASAAQIATQLKMSPYFVNQSIAQAKKFSKEQLEEHLLAIAHYAKAGLGMQGSAGPAELLKELCFKLMG